MSLSAFDSSKFSYSILKRCACVGGSNNKCYELPGVCSTSATSCLFHSRRKHVE
ncbi:hypothetical protein ARMSODRAFT_954889 [Armillaria solidipes]|uniref:Uncharacterized protein n=1 Tax=Armillaria solidipes TaxID=1076256 RepID=A0A2H3BN84_9AGAR|nr:hypothetical protein ARMSODRAFT_954889 [Armillaria solidipes]